MTAIPLLPPMVTNTLFSVPTPLLSVLSAAGALPDGARVTDAGETRLTDAGDIRIIE